MTAEELLQKPSDDLLFELIAGEIRTTAPSSAQHGRVASRVGRSLGTYVQQHDLGEMMALSGFILRRQPDYVRAADVAFVRKNRWNEPEGYFEGAPDLAIEVVAPKETYIEVTTRIDGGAVVPGWTLPLRDLFVP